MNRIVRATIVVAFLAAAAASANAQQQAPGPRRDRPSEEQREAVRKKVDAVRIVRLTETLKLDEKTAAAFIPVITALEQKRRELHEREPHHHGGNETPAAGIAAR